MVVCCMVVWGEGVVGGIVAVRRMRTWPAREPPGPAVMVAASAPPLPFDGGGGKQQPVSEGFVSPRRTDAWDIDAAL